MEVHRGEVFYADLSPVVGSEQGGVRPVLIVQNEIGNRHSPTVIAAAITSRLDKARLPTHINIRAEDTGLAKDSVVPLFCRAELSGKRRRMHWSARTKNGILFLSCDAVCARVGQAADAQQRMCSPYDPACVL